MMTKTLGFMAAALLLAQVVYGGGNFTVNTESDTHDANPGNGVAADANGLTSLRAAIEEADALGGSSTINLRPGTYNLSNGDLLVGTLQNTTIYLHGTGTAASAVIHQNTAGDMIFNVDPNVVPNIVFTADNVTVTGGSENELDPNGFGGNGGAILAGGSTTATGNFLTLSNVVFSGNYCSPSANAGASGGAIDMTGGGSLSVYNCTFIDNSASKFSGTGYGGAIYFDAGFAPGNVTIQNSIFANNSARNGQAGAIYLAGGVNNTYTLAGNTFTGNTAGAAAQGGAIFLSTGSLTANFNRFTGNVAGTGSGLYMSAGTSPYRSADVRNNWWGANGGPAGGLGADSVSPATNSAAPPGNGQISFDPWIILKSTASPNPILVGHSATVTASFLQNSAGGSLTAAQIPALLGLPVSWIDAQNGNVSGQQTSIQPNGTATAIFTAASYGTGTLEAIVDNVPSGDTSATASITIYQPPAITSANGTNFVAGMSGTFTVTDTGYPTPALKVSGALPSGVTFNPGTAILSGTPGANTGGTYPLTITATNAGGTITQSFTLTVDQAPGVNCPAGILTNATGGVCSSPSIAFAATVSGFPTPTVIYQLGSTTIISPTAFPLGTNVVNVTAMNVAGTNTCSFTVTVAPGAPPQLVIVHQGTNAVVSWPSTFPCYTLQFATALGSNIWINYSGPFVTIWAGSR
jgi:hypothetical protein